MQEFIRDDVYPIYYKNINKGDWLYNEVGDDIETGDLLYSDGTSIFKLTPEKLHEVLHGSGIVKFDKDPLKLEITYD